MGPIPRRFNDKMMVWTQQAKVFGEISVYPAVTVQADGHSEFNGAMTADHLAKRWSNVVTDADNVERAAASGRLLGDP